MMLLDEPSPAFDALCAAIARAHADLPLHLVEDTARHYAENRGIAYAALCVATGSEPSTRLDAKVAAHEDYATVCLVAQAADRSKWDASTTAAASLIIKAIGADVAAGVIPWDVPDFAAVHSFVDGNLYGLDLLEQIGWEFSMADNAQYDWTYAVEEIVNQRLGGSRPARWETDPEGYATWAHASKVALIDSRATAFGLSRERMMAHDGVTPADL
jgi:hypothetical protein